MASLMDELLDTLKKEREAYQRILPIAERKTEVIVRNDLNELQEVTVQEQEVVSEITALEKKREEVIIHIGTVLSRNPKTLTLKTLTQLMKNQPEEQKQLSEIHDTLSTIMKQVNEVNAHNKALLAQSLEMVEYSMNLIRSSRMTTGNTYTRNASQNDVVASRTGMFDAKQ